MLMRNPNHPGEILREDYLEPLGLSVTDAAAGLGVTRQNLSAIVNGKRGVSSEMAYRLAKAFGTTPAFWINLQAHYDLAAARRHVNTSGVKVYRRATTARA
ncbi:MAG: HigA family addiction module antitoxin [Thermoanaerobaculia bacterium]